jgi:hypothetical protein
LTNALKAAITGGDITDAALKGAALGGAGSAIASGLSSIAPDVPASATRAIGSLAGQAAVTGNVNPASIGAALLAPAVNQGVADLGLTGMPASLASGAIQQGITTGNIDPRALATKAAVASIVNGGLPTSQPQASTPATTIADNSVSQFGEQPTSNVQTVQTSADGSGVVDVGIPQTLPDNTQTGTVAEVNPDQGTATVITSDGSATEVPVDPSVKPGDQVTVTNPAPVETGGGLPTEAGNTDGGLSSTTTDVGTPSAPVIGSDVSTPVITGGLPSGGIQEADTGNLSTESTGTDTTSGTGTSETTGATEATGTTGAIGSDGPTGTTVAPVTTGSTGTTGATGITKTAGAPGTAAPSAPQSPFNLPSTPTFLTFKGSSTPAHEAALKQIYDTIDPELMAAIKSAASAPQGFPDGGAVESNLQSIQDRIDQINRADSKDLQATLSGLGQAPKITQSKPTMLTIQGSPNKARMAQIKHLFPTMTPEMASTMAARGLVAPQTAAHGGLMHLLPEKYREAAPKGHNHEFVTGLTGFYASGKGTGQSDDIPAMLHDGDYVMDADTVAAFGDGSSKAGSEALAKFQHQIPHPAATGGEAVPAKIADGEYVLPAAFVTALGGGSNKVGSKMLDHMREELRAHKRSAPTSKIPPKAKSPLDYLRMAKG